MWQPVLMINGFLIAIIGLSMLVPAAYDVAFSNLKWSPFLTAALIAVFSGLALFLGNRMKINKITLKQGFLITVVGWVSVCCFATIPFMLYGACDSLADAFFETISGLTTTGGTIFADVEKLPKSILLWRSILNAVGGLGIVIFAVAMLPFLGIGGMQIFQRENSDMNEKFMPKFSYIAKRIVIVQVILIFVCFLCLCWAGMGKFDALNHAMATIATGGLSTKNASIGYFDSVSIEMIVSLFMILGSLPMTFYIVLWQRKDWKEFGTSQIWAFLKILVIYILATSVYLTYIGVYDWWRAVRYSSFNIISVVTTTGFVSTDYNLWGSWVVIPFMIFAMTGGCTGSTSGSIKILRWQVLFAYIKRAFVVSTEPNRVVPLKVGNNPTDMSVVSSVFVLFAGFILSIAFMSCLVTLDGYDLEIALSSVVACISNSGPGAGSLIGPAGNYGSLSDFTKWVLSITMLLGRLEVITVVTVLTKSFWTKN